MIQDIAEKNGSMNTDVVTGALERSTNRIIMKRELILKRLTYKISKKKVI